MRHLILGLSLLVPFATSAADLRDDEIWQLSGDYKKNTNEIRKTLEARDSISKAIVDPNTGEVSLKSDRGRFIDDEKVLSAIAQFRNVSITKVSD